MKAKGQYFTTSKVLLDKISEFIKNESDVILEPSIGKGHVVHSLAYKNTAFDMFEIDESLDLLPGIDKEKVVYGDFLTQNILKKYTTIVGNPPYVRTKTGNLYLDFIKKCVDLLDENGELIFVVPSDVFTLTSAKSLMTEMFGKGCITHVFHPGREDLFEKASIDVLVFRYCKNSELEKITRFNGENKNMINTNGIITFSNETCSVLIKDCFDIYVGLVSGKETVFKNYMGNVEILTSKRVFSKYIIIDKFPSGFEEIDKHLETHKKDLLARKIRKMTESNWFEFGALRNKKIMETKGKCIYMYNLTRKTKVAFCGEIGLFGANLLMMVPKKNINLQEFTNFINSDFKNRFIQSGRFKIGHRQLCNSLIDASHIE